MPGAKFHVFVMQQARNDLLNIRDHIARGGSPGDAVRVMERLEARIASLEDFPFRGAMPKELEALGNHDYRQLVLSPYRLVYRILDNGVFVMLIADGRRDMKTLLRQRLLAPDRQSTRT